MRVRRASAMDERQGLFAPRQFYACPLCGALLDSVDDLVLVERGKDPADAAGVAGCSRCLRALRAERMEWYAD